MEQHFTDDIISSLFISKKDSEHNGIIYKYLGKGGTGVVYKINENNIDRAIKIIPKNKYNENEYKIGSYLNSILNISTINFIRIYDKITLKSYVIIKMEYIPYKLHPRDEVFLNKNKEKYCLEISIEELREKYGNDLKSDNVREKFINYKDNKNKILTNLLAIPFFGDVKNAKIYILTGNPGFHTGDYVDEVENKKYIEILKENLKLNTKTFVCLKNDSINTGGYKYWSNSGRIPKISKYLNNLNKEPSFKNYIYCIHLTCNFKIYIFFLQ